MADESEIAEKWLRTVLSGDATLQSLVGTRIYNGRAPSAAALPYVWFFQASAAPRQTINFTRIGMRCVYLIQAVGSTTFSDLSGIASRIDALLHRAAGSVTGGHVESCVRGEMIKRIYTEQGINYHSHGAYFDVVAWVD